MSKTRKTPNYQLEDIQKDIEQSLISLDLHTSLDFARSPERFVAGEYEQNELRYLVTQRMGAIASAMLASSQGRFDRGEKTHAGKIVSALAQNLDDLNDLSLLSESSRKSFAETIMRLAKHCGLKDRNSVAYYVGEISPQLKVDEIMPFVKFIGDSFKAYPSGNKAGLSVGFRKLLDRLDSEELDLTVSDQRILRDTFESIFEHGNTLDIDKSFHKFGKYLLTTPDLFDENLDFVLKTFDILSKSKPANGKELGKIDTFHTFVAAYSGRFAEAIRNFQEDVDQEGNAQRVAKFKEILENLATHRSEDVRLELVEEMGFVLRKLDDFDHEIDDVVDILSRDSSPKVAEAFQRQVERGFIKPADCVSIER